MVGLVVGEVPFEQMDLTVDGIGEIQAFDQQQRSAQATKAATANFGGDVVVDVLIGEQATLLLLPASLGQPTLDPTLAIFQPILYGGVHLKSFGIALIW